MTHVLRIAAAGTVTLLAALGVQTDRAQARDGADMTRGGAFARLDANGDGSVSAEEFADPAAARFGASDADGDGLLTAKEIAAFAEKRRVNRQAARAEAVVARLDADGNGAVSLEEMQTRGRGAIFERLDADADGTISQAEMRAGRAAMRDRNGARQRD